jgi:hypothetical protein
MLILFLDVDIAGTRALLINSLASDFRIKNIGNTIQFHISGRGK